ncbi:hypothetical protein BaRGS_00003187 [Batillaria attramentaria]|uniref:Uncharacterized protein n=1 Tax=Batillaria attramentaria TaxID=370345 RepID=A0ABD0M165_9CAEN
MEPRRLLFLALVMVVYLCVGAAIFNALEADAERDRKEELEAQINEFIGKASAYSLLPTIHPNPEVLVLVK